MKMVLKRLSFVFICCFAAAVSVFAAQDADMLLDLSGVPNVSSVAIVRQTNSFYQVNWESPKGTRRFAKIIFPLPRTAVTADSQYYYELDLRKLEGEIDGMTLGRHDYAAADGRPCFAGRYFGPLKKSGKYQIPMKALANSDSTILDRIALSSRSRRFSAEFALSLHNGTPGVASSCEGLDFLRVYGWIVVVGLVVALLIKWLFPVRADMPQDFKVGRYGSIDVLKGLGCIAVVLIHYNFPGWTGRIVWASCRFAVPLFFCISGFFLIDREGRITVRSLARKAGRLIVLLSTVILVYHLYLCLVPEFAPRLVGARLFGLTAGFWLNNSLFPVIWFVGALIYCYAFLILFCGRMNRLAFWILAFVLWLGCFYLYDINATWPLTVQATPVRALSGAIVWPNFFIFRAMPFLLIGLFLRIHIDSIKKWFRNSWIPLVLAVLGFGVSVGEMMMTGRVQFSTGCTFSMVVMFAWAIGNPDGGIRLLRIIGSRASLWVYLAHVPIGTLLMKIARAHGFGDETWFKWSSAFLVISLSIGFAFAVDTVKRILLERRK